MSKVLMKGNEAIAEATRITDAKDLQNIRFVVKDLSGFNEQGKYDLITSFMPSMTRGILKT